MLRSVDALTQWGAAYNAYHERPNQAATRCAVRLSMPEPIVVGAGEGRHTHHPSCRQPSLEALCAYARPAIE